MRRRGDFVRGALGGVAAAAVLALAAAPVHAAGFSIFEQGGKASGMAGAFTAQADDPSALFYNVGGLGLVNKSDFSIGLTYVQGTQADYRGRAPFPGPQASGEQNLLHQPIPQAYYVSPINATWKWGIGLEAPFGLTTDWKNPDQFPGRFLSTKAAIRAVDINPSLGWQLTPDIGLGAGVVIRASDVNLRRNAPAVNPFTQNVVNAAHVDLKSDVKTGYGWNLGIVDHYNNSFSWGLSYRSKVKVDYDGDARLTQVSSGNAQFDAIIRSRLPFDKDLPVETEIEFPDEASLGLAFGLTPNLLLETDFNYTGWSSFDELPINFTGGAGNSLPSTVIPENWDDAYNYRAGLRWTASPTSQWRFGYVFDETPQPEEAVSPLLPDADRNGFTLGYGHSGAIGFDVAVMYLDFKERTRNRSFPGESIFFGTYNTQALLVGVTLNF